MLFYTSHYEIYRSLSTRTLRKYLVHIRLRHFGDLHELRRRLPLGAECWYRHFIDVLLNPW